MSVYREQIVESSLDDFKRIIQDIDGEIFAKEKRPLARVVVRRERSVGMRNCVHVGRYSSVLFRLPKEWCETATPLRQNIDSYVIWKETLAKMVENLLKTNIVSLSDTDLNKFWFISAIALVRVRVLHHPEWFPNAKRRNIRSMAKHHEIVGPELFCLKKDFEETQRALINLDVYLTQCLIASAIERNMPHAEVLRYIATD